MVERHRERFGNFALLPPAAELLRRRRIWSGTTTVALIIFLGGCSEQSSNGADTTESIQSVCSQSLELEGLVTGASEYPVGREWVEFMNLDFSTIGKRQYDERERRIVSCMKARGFVYSPVRYEDADRVQARAANPLLESVAKRFGYDVPRPAPVENSNETGEALMTALNGSGDDITSGCAWSAYEVYRAESEHYFDLVNELLNDLYTSVDGYFATPEGQSLMMTWSSCMAGSGYEFASQEEAARSFAGAPTRPAPNEIAVRMADLACDRQAGLTAKRSDWERTQFEAWAERSADAVRTLEALESALVQRLGELEAQVL
jgi:hypothetical protein